MKTPSVLGRIGQLFSTENSRLIGRLLSDQGRRHWAGYAVAIVMTVIVAWTTSLSAYIMRDVINQIFIAKNLGKMWYICGLIMVKYLGSSYFAIIQVLLGANNGLTTTSAV